MMKIIVKDIFNGVQSEIDVPDNLSDKVRYMAVKLNQSQAKVVLSGIDLFASLYEKLISARIT